MGWNLLPLYVGLQAPCVSQSGLAKVSTSPTTAATQGRVAADDAAGAGDEPRPAGRQPDLVRHGGLQAARRDVHEGGAVVRRARWDAELHARGFVPGVYGSAASTIRDVSQLQTVPDLVWIANWNGVQSVFGDPNVSDELWSNHQRIHQYKGGHNEAYGGVTINIDSSVVDSTVVGGSAPPPPPPTPPPPAGQVNSGDGLATASWPAAAFATQAVVTLTPVAQPPAPNGYGVQLTAVETDNQAPISGFGAPVTVHLLKQPTGLEPAFSTDGVDLDGAAEAHDRRAQRRAS